MKKGFLFLAGSAILLASCGSNNNKEEQSKAQIDSTVNAEVAAKEAAMKAQNDSTIVAQAKAKADSEMIAKEAIAKDHVAHGGKTTKHTQTKTVTPPPPPVNVRPGSDNGGSKSVNDRPGAH